MTIYDLASSDSSRHGSVRGREPRLLTSFRVDGIPAPQGSKKGFVIGGKAIMVESSKTLPVWRKDVARASHEAMEDYDDIVMKGPIKVMALFTFPRPASHFGTGKNKGNLKESAPAWKDSTPDTDKLERALGDAMSGQVYRDDAQIAWWDARRMYGSNPGVSVHVYLL